MSQVNHIKDGKKEEWRTYLWGPTNSRCDKANCINHVDCIKEGKKRSTGLTFGVQRMQDAMKRTVSAKWTT